MLSRFSVNSKTFNIVANDSEINSLVHQYVVNIFFSIFGKINMFLLIYGRPMLQIKQIYLSGYILKILACSKYINRII